MSRQCFLRCLVESHAPIQLPHGVETIIGRSKTTQIKDQACSRKQVSLKADCEKCEVELKQLGVNPAGLDGFALMPNSVLKIKHGSRIEVLLNHYMHVVEFNPPPDGSQTSNLKRKIEEESMSPNKKNKLDHKTSTATTYSNHCKASSKISEAKQSSWEERDKGELYIFTSKGTKSSCKIAAFDMDGTLIKTKSGKVHPVDTKDWQIALPTISQKLKDLITQGFKLVILTNQAAIGNGRMKVEDFQLKVESIIEKLNVPIQAYVATGKGIYRKPATGMWKVLVQQKNDSLAVDMNKSFYCGDAAGRVANWAPGKKKDHSMADKLLAENLGLKFYTPEEFFLGHSVANVQFKNPDFVPKDLKPEPFNEKLISEEQEILVLVGYPGSGKSFLAKQISEKSGTKYQIVCRDELGSWQKCAAVATGYLKEGKSVIVDSTNADVESRGRWVSLAKEMQVECRCATMAAGLAHAQHNNKFRELMKIKHAIVTDIVFHTFKNKFVEPTLAEGFKEVITVKFSPSFKDAEAEKLYRMHLLEK